MCSCAHCGLVDVPNVLPPTFRGFYTLRMPAPILIPRLWCLLPVGSETPWFCVLVAKRCWKLASTCLHLFRSPWLKQPVTQLSAALASCKGPYAALHNKRKETTPTAALCCSPPCGVRAVSSRFVVCEICTWKDLKNEAGRVMMMMMMMMCFFLGIELDSAPLFVHRCFTITSWRSYMRLGSQPCLRLPVCFVQTELLGLGLLKSRWRREASIVESQQQGMMLIICHTLCSCCGCKAGFCWKFLGALLATKVCWMLVTLPSCSAWTTWVTRPWHGPIWMRGNVWCGLPPSSWMPCRYRRQQDALTPHFASAEFSCL